MIPVQPNPQIVAEIVALERAALERWGAGDPSGFLELCCEDVSYFDPFVAHPIVGLPALTAYYEPLRGTIRIERSEMRDARVQLIDKVAVLTFQFASWGSETALLWNCTEVYRLEGEGPRICHTHWSFTSRPSEPPG